jgi:hypothetical protein
MHFQTRRQSASSLGGLGIVAMILVARPSLRDTPAAQWEPGAPRQSQDGGRPAPPNPHDQRALEEFLGAYRLAPGQDIKRVPPPRSAGARVWYGLRNPGRLGRPDDVRAMVFGWRDPDQLQVWATWFGEPWTIRDLPARLKMGINPLEVEGNAELIDAEVDGDWVVREGVSAERLIRPLDAVLQRALRKRITLALRRVERDVVVARGRYRPSPLPGHAEDEIEIFAHELVLRGTGGSGNFSFFINSVAGWIGRPVLNEVESPPKAMLFWRYNRRHPSTEQSRREDHDEGLVLQHLQEQTGLTFIREKRPIRILFVEKAGASR